MTAVKGTYANLRPIKSRKVWVLEIEVPEEEITNTTNILGFPNQSESKWVGVALLNKEVMKPKDMSLVTRAVMLCKNGYFHNFLAEAHGIEERNESSAVLALYSLCGMSSRSELASNDDAQSNFKELLERYEQWKTEKNYGEYLEQC